MTGLKLVEAGVPKDRLALMAVPMSPLQVLLPFFISKYTAGPRPMSLFLRAMPWRWVARAGVWGGVTRDLGT